MLRSERRMLTNATLPLLLGNHSPKEPVFVKGVKAGFKSKISSETASMPLRPVTCAFFIYDGLISVNFPSSVMRILPVKPVKGSPSNMHSPL